ncbi:hypothetical protein [Streptacidiphilus sp. PB12-B1b]|uniref:hypothetical protein n=1 Tax=Streptacidiphilus sp. PB12-B1b TaxID=2705012 RepID=UPI0015F7BF54|nr:hypothetical protein [Streptacidiphilus sp. PB12-B1b]
MAQQAPGPDTAPRPGAAPGGPQRPAHARARAAHWLGTAAALAALVAAVLAVAPADATAPVPDGPHALPAADAPDPARAAYPLGCDGLPVKVSQSFSADLTGRGADATVAAAHCLSATGTPPDGLYILRAGGPGGRPRIAVTLITPGQDLTVRSVTVRSDGSILADVDGYSSPDVPRCCADVHETFTWTPHGAGYTRTVSTPDAET